MIQLPRNLKRNRRLARARRQREQNPFLSSRNRLQHIVDRDLLVVPRTPGAALVFIWNSSEAIAPRVLNRERAIPQLFRCREAVYIAFLAGLHVDAVDGEAVGRICEPYRQLLRIRLGLTNTFTHRRVALLRLDRGQLVVAEDQHIVRNLRFAALAATVQPSRRDHLAPHAAAFNFAPACRFQGRVDQLGAGFGFIHLAASILFSGKLRGQVHRTMQHTNDLHLCGAR